MRPFPWTKVLLTACLLLLLGCAGGGSGGSGGSSLQGPSSLTVAYDASTNAVHLTWAPAPGTVDGYDIEMEVPGSLPFTQVNTTLVPSLYHTANLTFTTPPPELTTLVFRIRAARGSDFSDYSNQAQVQTPLTPPTGLTAFWSSQDGGVQVDWGDASLAATQVVLQRAPCNASGSPTGPWTTLPLQKGPVSAFLDLDVPESQTFVYQVTNQAGSVRSSADGPSNPVLVPLKVPANLAAQSQVGAVTLSWTNRSRAATQVLITRSDVGLLATLAPTATSYQDATVPFGYFTYGVNVTDGPETTTGPTVVAAPSNPAGSPALSPLPLTVSQPPNAAALSASGSWAMASDDGTFFTIYPASWGTWPSFPSTGDVWTSSPFLAVDPAGHPHAAFTSQDFQASPARSSLVHLWYDGTVWNQETVVQYPNLLDTTILDFRLDSTGTAQFIQDTGSKLVYIHKTAGAWASEDTQAGTYSYGRPRLCLDPADEPHLLIPGWLHGTEMGRNPDGTWSSTAMTDLSPFPNGGAFYWEDGAWADGNTAWAFCVGSDPSNPGNDALVVAQKVGGTWQSSSPLRSYAHQAQTLASCGLSPDGKRVALAIYTPFGLELFTQVQGVQGWIHALVAPPSQAYPTIVVGFDSGDRLHLLTVPSVYEAAATDYHE